MIAGAFYCLLLGLTARIWFPIVRANPWETGMALVFFGGLVACGGHS